RGAVPLNVPQIRYRDIAALLQDDASAPAWHLGRPSPHERRSVVRGDRRCLSYDHAGGADCWRGPGDRGSPLSGYVTSSGAAPTWRCCSVRVCRDSMCLMVHLLGSSIDQALSMLGPPE